MKSKILKLFHILILIIIGIIITGSLYIKYKYTATTFDELVFYLKAGVENADKGVFIHTIKQCLVLLIGIFLIIYILFYDITFGKLKLRIKKLQLYPIKIINNHRVVFTTILFIGALALAFVNFGVYEYSKNTLAKSDFIEENYVFAKDPEIEFDEKRNLIFIVVESLETTFFTKEQGGYWDYEVTPELYELLNDEDAVTFYNENKAQGVNMITGASWTTASVVANTTGVPFKIPIEQNSYHSDDFLNGVYSLGDLLKDNGYYNELISTATTSFGGIKEYYTKHGNFEIIDKDSLGQYNLEYDKDDLGAWGINDNYLFEIAKKRLDIISKQDKPFNMNLITIDTHFPSGYVGNYSIKKYDSQYENAYATTSKLIYNFVNWVKEQEYYDDTTIVIVGDHLSMQSDYFTSRGINGNRYVYNCILNSYETPLKESKRIPTALDYYPTIVASIGGKIEDDKLGLGVNLFSDKKTLAEKKGLEYLNNELVKKSDFYDENILNDTYFANLKEQEIKEKIMIIEAEAKKRGRC